MDFAVDFGSRFGTNGLSDEACAVCFALIPQSKVGNRRLCLDSGPSQFALTGAFSFSSTSAGTRATGIATIQPESTQWPKCPTPSLVSRK